MSFYIRMNGGLGNQMFQYAYSFVLKERFKRNDTIYLDVRGFKNYYRNFDLFDFCLNDNCVLFKKGHLRYDFSFRIFHLYRGLLKHLFKKRLKNFSRLFAKRGKIYCDISCSIPEVVDQKNIYLYGYFQNAAILLEHRNSLCDSFTLRGKGSNNYVKVISSLKQNNVVISIRISENNKLEHLKYTSKDYYVKAVDKLLKTTKINQIVLMSNRLDVVKNECWFDKYGIDLLYVNGCSPAEQIEIMKKCDNYIISNSTFAWWGAFLGNTKKQGIIIAPEDWYGNDKLKDTKMMFDEITII